MHFYNTPIVDATFCSWCHEDTKDNIVHIRWHGEGLDPRLAVAASSGVYVTLPTHRDLVGLGRWAAEDAAHSDFERGSIVTGDSRDEVGNPGYDYTVGPQDAIVGVDDDIGETVIECLRWEGSETE